MKVCKGCGVKLQTSSQKSLGYVVDINMDYCQNCFKLKHYSKPVDEVVKSGFPVVSQNGLIVCLVSALTINDLFKYNLKRIYPEQEIILVINKIDLFSKNIKYDLWVKELFKIFQKQKLNIIDIIPISALTGKNVDTLVSVLKRYVKKDIYVIGFQNSGKSTLLNQIAKSLKIDSKALASLYPGLTKGFIKLKFNQGFIIDTPGVYLKGNISDYLPYQDYKGLMPTKKINPKNYYLDAGQAIILGGFLIVSYLKGKKNNFTFYLGNVSLHRSKYEKVYELFNRQQGTLFKPTTKADFVKSYLTVKDDKKVIISLLDLGFLVIKGELTLEIYAPKDANITVESSYYHGL